MPENHLTISDIVKRTGCSLYRVQYFIKALHIKPQCKIGPAWIYTAQDAERIKAYVEKLDSRKQ